MTAALQWLEGLSVWEVENRYGLQIYRNREGRESAYVVVQVAAPNLIIAVPFCVFSPEDLALAHEAGYRRTSLGRTQLSKSVCDQKFQEVER